MNGIGSRVVILVVAAVMIVGGCSDDSGDDSSSDTTAATSETATDGLGVSLTQEGCVSSTDEVAMGPVSLVFTNESPYSPVPVYVIKLTEGHTYEDLEGVQEAAGGGSTYFARPEWIDYALRSFEAIPVELQANQTQYVFDLTPGVHAIYTSGGSPEQIWLCGSLTVTEA